MLLKRTMNVVLMLLAALSLYAMRVDEAGAVITFQSAGAVSDSNVTSIDPAYPASVAAGDLLILIIGMKPSAANSGSVATPESWTLITSATGQGGYGATLGGDTGNTNVFAYYKVAEGNETGSLRVRLTTNNISWAQMYRLTNATQDWSIAGTTGSDTTAGNVSITMGADPGVTAGDFILGAMVIPTDVSTPGQFSAQAFAQTGVTFGAVTEISEPDAATGNDIGGFVVHSTVASGTGSAAPVLSATAGGTTTNVRGPGVFIRVRATGAITFETPGAIDYIDATVATSVCPAHPASVADGDLLVTIIGMKPSAASSGSVTTPSGWTAVPGGSLTGAGNYGGTLGADTGNTNVFSFYRVARGDEATERCFELATNSVSWAQMYRYSSTNQGWSLNATTGSDITAGNVSITFGANPNVTLNDHILGAMVIPTDVSTPAQFSAEAFTQTGATFAAAIEISEPDSANGNDIGGFVIRSSVTAGTGSAAPVMTATAGGTTTNVRGPGVFIRIRETSPAFTQAAFGFYADGSETGSTALAAQDTNITIDVTPGTTNFQLRVRIQETNAASGAATDDYRLQYSKNGAAYTNVTAATANVRGFNSSMAEGDPTTKRLTGGTGAFLAGEVSEAGEVVNHRITYSKHTEYLYALTLVPADFVLSSNTLDFRVLRNGVVMTYSVTPRITVVKPTAPSRFNAVDTGADVITGRIKTKLSATNFATLDIVAINAAGTGVETGFFGDVKVQVYDGLPGGTPDVTTKCSPSWTLIGTTPTSYTVTLTAGAGTINLINVANAYKDARIRIAYPATGTEFRVGCSSDNFAIRPSSLDTLSITDNDWASATPGTSRNLDNTSATGGVVHKAGQPFRIAATARNSAAAATSNYNGTPVGVPVNGVLPSAGTCGTVTCGTVSTANWTSDAAGRVTTLEASYSEVGAINMILQDQNWADVDISDSNTSERYFSSAAVDVGRFVPDHFTVSAGSTPTFRTYGTTDASCQTPPSGNKRVFTYIGQSFGYTAIVPVTTFTAKNAAGNTTLNYTGSLIHTGSITATQTYSPAPAILAATINAPNIAAGPANSGTGTVTSSASDSFSYVRNNTTPQGPFTAAISLDVSVSDASEAGANQGTITTTFTSVPFPSIGFDSGAVFRYGRLRLLNATGSGLADLPVPMTAQYWDGSKFVTNTDDHCTSLASNTNVTLAPYTGGVNGTNLGAPGHISLTGGEVKSGVGFVKITKPSPALAAKGTATPAINLTGESKTYLQGNWNGSPTYSVNPSSRAAFGVFGSQPRNVIFNRENY
jgi:hypothetical protein